MAAPILQVAFFVGLIVYCEAAGGVQGGEVPPEEPPAYKYQRHYAQQFRKKSKEVRHVTLTFLQARSI
jgi:hypothetical protein